MKYRFMLLPAIACILLWSCKDHTGYIISGTLMQDCNGTPITNMPLELWQGDGAQKATVAKTTTDANGYFRFEYNSIDVGSNVSIKTGNGLGWYTYMENIPPSKHYSDVLVFQKAKANVRVMLSVLKSYTNLDTLYVNDMRTFTTMKIPGPFTSGELYTVNNFPILVMGYPGTKMTVAWKLNAQNNTQYAPYTITDYSCNAITTATITLN